jgi:hypothetical protein
VGGGVGGEATVVVVDGGGDGVVTVVVVGGGAGGGLDVVVGGVADRDPTGVCAARDVGCVATGATDAACTSGELAAPRVAR